MESAGEDLDNIFEEYENDENETGADNTENGQTTNESSNAVRIAPPKRVVKNPRLKFNPERLCGERGIPVLVDHFKNVNFKGVGHEKEDLDKLLSKLEHWTHRLFPSMKFEDCLLQIEKLGKKRPVQTCLRKIRQDMPILNNDFLKDDDDDDIQRNDDPVPEVDAFDRLIEQSQDVLNSDVSPIENVSDSSSFYSSPFTDTTRGHVLGSSFGSSMTEEQKERMERNRMLAAERRKARLAALQQNTVEPTTTTDQEVVPHQNISNAQNSPDKLFGSSVNKQENVQNIDDDSAMEISLNIDEAAKELSSELQNENSENLELDDLLDLVNEEEPVSDNSSTVSADQLKTAPSSADESARFSKNDIQEIDCSYTEQKDDVRESDKTGNKTALSLKIPEAENEDNSGVESLLDLVNENYVDCDVNSDQNCVLKDTTTSDIGKESDSNKELNAMNYEEES